MDILETPSSRLARPCPSGPPTVDAGPPSAPLGAVLLVASGPGEVALAATLEPGGRMDVGRAVAGGLRLQDVSVSSRHASFEHDGRRITIRDLGSRNGVRLGGARVREAALGLGESARLGRVTITLLEPMVERSADAVPLRGLIGRSGAMLRLAAEVRQVAPLRLPVLVLGESGTGKELVARALHDEGPRRCGPFVALNAAAIARELAESELFGHERGAFTGAVRERRGAFREAHGGTLFVDEIASLPLEVQAKLLRVVEDGVVRPLGGEARRAVDVRLVAATCEPLEQMVAARAFRLDLFERLAACVVRVPPLRARSEDVPWLADHLLAECGLGSLGLEPAAAGLLRREPWPGNVRELRNVLVQSALRAGAGPISALHVAAALAVRRGLSPRPTSEEARRLIRELGGNVSAAARQVGLPRSTLRDLARAP